MNTGMDVRIQTADRKGTPVGAPITLASDGRAFGAPAVAIGASGRGVVAFLQSGDHGFALVTASLDCHVPDGCWSRQLFRSGPRGRLAHRRAEGVAVDGLSEHAMHTEPAG